MRKWVTSQLCLWIIEPNMWAHLGMEMTKDIISTRTIGIVSGAVWANEAWGNYWSWDPKESDILDLYGFVIQCAEDLVTGDLGLDHLVGLCWILAHKALCKECERKRKLSSWQSTCFEVCQYFFQKIRIELSTCADPSPLCHFQGCNLVGTPGRARRSEHSASWCEPFGSTPRDAWMGWCG